MGVDGWRRAARQAVAEARRGEPIASTRFVESHSASWPSGTRIATPSATSCSNARAAASRSGDVVRPLREKRRRLCRRQAVRELLEKRLRSLRSGPPDECAVEVREQNVVGEDRLPAAGDQPPAFTLEDERGCREADWTVGSRGLALGSAGDPAAVRASARSRAYSAATSRSSSRSTIASVSIPSTRRSTSRICSSSSSSSDVVK